jgi:hypothetical protein
LKQFMSMQRALMSGLKRFSCHLLSPGDAQQNYLKHKCAFKAGLQQINRFTGVAVCDATADAHRSQSRLHKKANS